MPKPSRSRLFYLAALVAFSAGCGGGDRYQGMDADALFRLAENELAEDQPDNAIDTLERLVVSFGDWPRLAEARLMLARSYAENGDLLTARSEYQRFLERYVGHPESPTAALGQCRSLAELAPDPQRDQGYTEEAITICGNVVVDYAGTPQAAEARELREGLRYTMAEKEYLNGNHYFRRRQYDPAIIYFGFVVDLYPESEFAPRALMGLYRSNQAIGYEDLATEAREQLLSEYPDSEEAAVLRGGETAS